MHKPLLWMSLIAGAMSPSLAGAATLELDGIGLAEDVACAGEDVSISGNGNRIRLSGACGAVEVYGSDHEVILDTASALTVSGAEISVSARSTSRLSVDTSRNRVSTAIVASGASASVEVDGAEHVLDLTFESAASVEINGADNELRWRGQAPTVASSGAGHRVQRQP